MSVKVELDKVRDQVGACRSCTYLLTVTGDGRPHAVSLRLSWEDDALVGGAGRTTAGNVGRSPAVSLLWPESGRDGYALIVDGTAEIRGEGEDRTVAVRPTGAVLHRTPAAPDDGPGCIAVFNH